MHKLFGSAPISPADGALIVAVGVVVMVILEIEKVLTRRFISASIRAS
jgi:hypothetical protein